MNTSPAYIISELDSNLLAFYAIFVFLMQSGFALLEGASVSRFSMTSITLKNILDFCAASVVYWGVGYAFAYGEDTAGFIGTSYFFNIPEDHLVYFFFQFTFASTAITIVSGASAERLRFHGYLLVSVVLAAFVYPVVTHWVWSDNGWLSPGSKNALFGVGVIDFAGGLVVHLTGASASLMCCIVGGFRNQHYSTPNHPPRFEVNVRGEWITNELPGSNPLLLALGVMLLNVGFYAFNMGSLITFHNNSEVAGLIAINTTLCGAGGAYSALYFRKVLDWIRSRTTRVKKLNLFEMWRYGDMLNGLLTGLVASTSGCAVVPPWAALISGIVAGMLYLLVNELLIKYRIDDPVGAIPVHGAGGVCGALFASFFAQQKYVAHVYGAAQGQYYGMFLGGGSQRFLACLVAVVAIFVWVSIITYLLAKLLYILDTRMGYKHFFLRRWESESVSLWSAGPEDEPDTGLLPIRAQDLTTSPFSGGIAAPNIEALSALDKKI